MFLDSADDHARPADPGLMQQMAMMIRALLASPVRGTLFALGAFIFAVIAVTAYVQILLNRWNQPFYDALARRDFHEFLTQLAIFALIAAALLVLNVAQRWLGEAIKLKLREGLVHDLVGQWLTPRRAFRLASAGPIGVNPDQRMHEDARHLTELSGDLGIGLLQSSILLATFIAVLWRISGSFAFPLGGIRIAIPGYMVWAAILFAGTGSLLSYWVGSGLIRRNADRYQRESELRFSLMRVNEHIDVITLAGGEADEARRIDRDLQTVLAAMWRLVNGVTNLTWITAGYGWLTLVVPIVAAAPAYFAGSISFGGLMMAVGAFNQVQQSLRWFVDNFSTIADWRATLLRVAGFRRAVVESDSLRPAGSRIQFTDGKPGRIVIDDLAVAAPGGVLLLQETHVEVAAGEHVLVVGEAGRTVLFRALAGLWPWGSGTVALPAMEETLYMPRNPYLPPGTLKEVLSYPGRVDEFRPEEFSAALAQLGLDDFAQRLDQQQRWDHELSEDEQQAMVLARIALHAPRWLIIDEALDAMNDEAWKRFRTLFETRLKDTGLIHIGRDEPREGFFTRVLHLAKNPRSAPAQEEDA